MILAALTVLLFCSCNTAKGWNINDLEKSEYPAVIPVTNAEMKLVNSTVEPDAENVPVTITNLSDLEYGYGYEPGLEVQYNNNWYVVPTLENTVWIKLLVILPAGETNNETFPLAEYYGRLPAGTYRFIKVLSTDGYPLPVTAEFTVD